MANVDLERSSTAGLANSLTRRLFGFATLHPANTALNIVYSLALLLSLSRTLTHDHYAQIVFLTAAALYIQPLDQAIGRIAFSELRAAFVRGEALPGFVAAMLSAQFFAIVVISISVPLALATWQNTELHYTNCLFLFVALLTNFWAFDLQSTAFALEANLSFVRLSLLNRSCQFLSLAILWVSGNFTVFAAISAAFFACFAAYASGDLLRRLGLSERVVPKHKWLGVRRAMAASLMSGLSDLLVLSSPYAVITLVFGVGSTLIVFDTVMKLSRLTMAGSRTLAEIILPRHSRMVIAGERAAANMLFQKLVALSVIASALPAAVVAVDPSFVFSILLGGNNVVPPQAGLAAAAIILVSGLYQPASLLMSFTNDRSRTWKLTLVATVASAAFLLLTQSLQPTSSNLLWAYAALLAVCGVFAAQFGRETSATIIGS